MILPIFPKELKKTVYSINYKKLYNQGYKAVVFDIDNTLTGHNAPTVEKNIKLMYYLSNIGFKIGIVSNNGYERVSSYVKTLEIFNIKVSYIYDAKKPLPKNYINISEALNENISKTIFIGDQLFTDVLGANLVGMYSIKVKPIEKDREITIKIKRFFENILLRLFYKEQ